MLGVYWKGFGFIELFDKVAGEEVVCKAERLDKS